MRFATRPMTPDEAATVQANVDAVTAFVLELGGRMMPDALAEAGGITILVNAIGPMIAGLAASSPDPVSYRIEITEAIAARLVLDAREG